MTPYFRFEGARFEHGAAGPTLRPGKRVVRVAGECLLFLVLTVAPFQTAAADPILLTESLAFSTGQQSMWKPGQGNVVDKGFDVRLINIDSSGTIGAISNLGATIPNPVYLAWKVAYDACRFAFSDSVCRNGATIPFVGRVGGLGNPPAQTLAVNLGKNGLALDYDVDIEAGFSGDFVLTGGNVDVTYPTTATLHADRSAYGPGELVTLTLSEVVGIPTMATEFSDLDLSLSAWADIDVQASIEAWVANQGGTASIADVDVSVEQELFGVSVGNAEIGLRIFGEPLATFDTSGGIGLNVFSVGYPPNPNPGGPSPIPQISLADFQIQVPDLDTPPVSAWNAQTASIVNTHFPIDRGIGQDEDLTLIGTGAGFHPTDFAKADVDLDGIVSVIPQPPVPLGLHAGIPGLITLEGNLFDLDLGAFFGVGQTLTFEPQLHAGLNFGAPVQVETAPGVFEEHSTWSLQPGETVSFLHPGFDLTVDPIYSLNNSFTNVTDLLLSPVATLAVLQLKLTGLGASLTGFNFDAALVQHVFPLGDPLAIARLGSSDPFTLEGFQPTAGQSLFLAAAPAGVPEPGLLALLAFGLGAAASRRQQRSGP